MLLFLAITISFSQKDGAENVDYIKEYLAADKLYQEAEKLSMSQNYSDKTAELEEQMNRRALNGFRSILPVIENERNDSLAFHCYYKIGVLEHYFDNLQTAQKSYLKAISLKDHLPSLPDSFLFKPYLYTGSIYYIQSFFDSALNNYKRADEIASQYPKPLSESQRLYNTMGVLYYETGNYIQAKNYFEKALYVLTPSVPFYRELAVNYKNNLASVLIRLEEYDKADSIYKSLLSHNISRDEILHNIGSINLNLGAFGKALDYFRQVNYDDAKEVRLLNDIGLAFAGLKEKDSAEIYFLDALGKNTKWNGNKKNIPRGLSFKYLGDLSAEQNNYEKATEFYQKAIIQFNREFNDSSVQNNPEYYSGIFSYINLFHTLTAKAEMLESLYHNQKTLKYLEYSLDAYRSAFSLADYVEKTYDSDEARMFLNKIKYTVHDKPIGISIDLFSITQDKQYLEQAYLFDQQNKASILSLNVRENEIRNTSGSLSEMFKVETSIKSAITRLSLRASQVTDSGQLTQINASIRDNEIRLSKLHEKMNDEPEYIRKSSLQKIPTINDIRQKLDNTSALLSYHLSEKELVVLLISKERFDYARIPVNDTFYQRIDSLKTILHDVQNAQRYAGNTIAGSLYQKLISPVIKKLNHIDHLVIIPDDELNYLPFEVLIDENRKYLLERFSVQYQFSTSLLLNENYPKKAVGSLAFAPFSNKGFSTESDINFEKLPFSKKEIDEFDGKIFLDSSATKNNFLRAANKYNIIHLATHARINNDQPLQSYIAFYPSAGKNAQVFLLYAQEIYNMRLDSVGLVILSACETGGGKLIKGEGLMSLSRAFAYAGCSNIITSLWKAEDKTTSFLTQRLHFYLDKNLREDKALREAKLDLLQNNSIDPRSKSPVYWSHLIFIGQYEEAKSSTNWWWFAGIIVFLGFLAFFVGKLKRRSS